MILQCACGESLEVDTSRTDDDERERRLAAAEEWSLDHRGDGHALGFNLGGIARGGPEASNDSPREEP